MSPPDQSSTSGSVAHQLLLIVTVLATGIALALIVSLGIGAYKDRNKEPSEYQKAIESVTGNPSSQHADVSKKGVLPVSDPRSLPTP